MRTRNLRSVFAYLLACSIFVSALPLAVHSQGPSAAETSSAYAAALSAIEEKVEKRRAELGIPGMSLAIVKDDKVIYAKGLGFKDFENKVPVTADTQFAIGSATKAFTALSVLMTADQGKISLDASPRTVLPYFKMADPDTDKNITIRDLLTHSSGLNRTDIAMITGKLTREQLIKVAGEAKPVAKLREKFGYQNLMYAAAGEVVTVAQKTPWEEFVPREILRPLGMNNSNMSIAEMAKAKDRSLGYNYNFDTKETIKLPYREIAQVAPAGSINSSANDMARWLRFVLGRGEIDGNRLISEKIFDEWLKPQMKVDPAGNVNYALGWFVQKWNGHTVVQHGGNIDGFNAMVAMIPEKKLGFVMLTNVSGSPLGNELMPIVWEGILGGTAPASTETVSPEKEAGDYLFEAANLTIAVEWKDGKLTASVPGQPTYTLERVSGRKYKLGGAPDGFFATFKENEMLLEQPQGNITLKRAGAGGPAALASPAAAKELVGKYTSATSGRIGEVKEDGGKITFQVGTQPPVTLTERGKDEYWMKPLPDAFFISVVRSADGKIEALAVNQPEGRFLFNAGAAKIDITADELIAKAIAAAGGEANLKKLTSRISELDVDLEQQGVKATVTTWQKAPNLSATETRMTALGIEIAKGWEYFDGTTGEEAYSFAPASKYTGKRLEDIKLTSDFAGLLDWKAKFKKVEVTRIAKCGDEECYVVTFEPKAASPYTEFYSTETFLLLRREGSIPSSTSSMQVPFTTRFDDYREVDGIKLPFRIVTNTQGNGDVVSTVRSIKHNAAIEDSLFGPRKLN